LPLRNIIPMKKPDHKHRIICIFIWIVLHNVFICKMHSTILPFGAFCYWKPFRKFRKWSRLDIKVKTGNIDIAQQQHKTNQSNPKLGELSLVKTPSTVTTITKAKFQPYHKNMQIFQEGVVLSISMSINRQID
jgi:hypothetical protein